MNIRRTLGTVALTATIAASGVGLGAANASAAVPTSPAVAARQELVARCWPLLTDVQRLYDRITRPVIVWDDPLFNALEQAGREAARQQLPIALYRYRVSFCPESWLPESLRLP